MTKEELRAKYPDEIAQVEADARASVDHTEAVNTAIQAERARMQEIDEISGLLDATDVQQAKYGDKPCSAADLLMAAAKNAAKQGKKFLTDLKDDSEESGAEGVPAGSCPRSRNARGRRRREERHPRGAHDQRPGAWSLTCWERRRRAKNMINLSEKLGEMTFDGLITDIKPAPEVRGGVIRKLSAAATLKRGTIPCQVLRHGRRRQAGRSRQHGQGKRDPDPRLHPVRRHRRRHPPPTRRWQSTPPAASTSAR